jgi:small-conductance mechanosensitive channel
MGDWEVAERFAAQVVNFLPLLATGLAILLAFWVAGWLADRAVRRVLTPRHTDPQVEDLLARAAKVALRLVGVITALGTVGVDVSALVGGLGLTGFALGFALKDIIANALSGVLLLVYKPFTRADLIKVGEFEGRVINITFRYTVLDADTKRAFVPNSMLYNTGVTVQPGPGGPAGTG